MSFLAVLLALLLDQARPVDETHPVRRALRRWVDAVRRQLDAGDARSGWLAWGVAVLGPAGLAGLAYLLLAALHPALAFAWLVLVLYLTLGFRQFSHHFTALREALFAGDDSAARRVLSDWEGLETDPRSGRPQVLRRAIAHAVLAAHHHVFGVLAAFLVLGVLGLGPTGAVLYRLAEHGARRWQRDPAGQASPMLRAVTQQAWRLIDFLPSRATALAFATVGNFEDAVTNWRDESDRHGVLGDGIVLAAAAGALNVRLDSRESDAPPSDDPVEAALDGPPVAGAQAREPQLAHLGSLVGLVWRSVVLWMLLLGLVGLVHLLT